MSRYNQGPSWANDALTAMKMKKFHNQITETLEPGTWYSMNQIANMIQTKNNRTLKRYLHTLKDDELLDFRMRNSMCHEFRLSGSSLESE